MQGGTRSAAATPPSPPRYRCRRRPIAPPPRWRFHTARTRRQPPPRPLPQQGYCLALGPRASGPAPPSRSRSRSRSRSSTSSRSRSRSRTSTSSRRFSPPCRSSRRRRRRRRTKRTGWCATQPRLQPHTFRRKQPRVYVHGRSPPCTQAAAFCIQARQLDETRALLGGAAVARVEQRLAALHQLELEHSYAQAGHLGLQPGHLGARAGRTWSGCSLDSVG